MSSKLAAVGNWLALHQRVIRCIQWAVIIIYASLIIIPVFLPLPDESATLFHHLTAFAEFAFWGIWWPFVLISMVLFGRLWCGIFCPEGALTEIANQHGRGRSIPKWMRWGGWPFVAFSLTTLYGQMISVYQYPKPALLILGGSTLAAIVVGYLYGKSSRVWCKYLCPVTGVFNLLSRLAPWRYQPLPTKWSEEQIQNTNIVRCPTLLALPKMTGSAGCLMCGKCGSSQGGLRFTARPSSEEIVVYGDKKPSIYDSILILFGLCGLALAAFQWPNSFWLQHFRDVIDSWFLAQNKLWVFNTNAPWWIFTHYPERNDVFSWLYGVEIIAYMLAIGAVLGTVLTALIGMATRAMGRFSRSKFIHLSQALIPLGGCSVFVGLFANTISLLQKYANIGFLWVNDFKALLLALASVWTLWLAAKIIRRYTISRLRLLVSLSFIFFATMVINYSWYLTLHVWALKSDSVAWNTFWY